MENQEKRNNQPIDERFLMNMMAGREKQDPQQREAEAQKEEVQVKSTKGRHKKNMDFDYEKLFFKAPGTAARNGKSVYIRPEYHERLSRIVQVIGEDKLTLYAYLDNLLEHHFYEFGEQITASFNEKYKPIL